MPFLAVRRAFGSLQGGSVVSIDGAALLGDLVASRGWPVHPSDAQLSSLGAALAALVQRSRPWGRSYLSNILAGRVPASRVFLAALQAMGSLEDGAPALLALSSPQQVRVAPGVVVAPGALILVASIKCAYVRCQLDFIPKSKRQRFHSLECRRLAAKLKRGG